MKAGLDNCVEQDIARMTDKLTSPSSKNDIIFCGNDGIVVKMRTHCHAKFEKTWEQCGDCDVSEWVMTKWQCQNGNAGWMIRWVTKFWQCTNDDRKSTQKEKGREGKDEMEKTRAVMSRVIAKRKFGVFDVRKTSLIFLGGGNGALMTIFKSSAQNVR